MHLSLLQILVDSKMIRIGAHLNWILILRVDAILAQRSLINAGIIQTEKTNLITFVPSDGFNKVIIR